MSHPNDTKPASTILVVDDNPTNLDVLSKTLENQGFTVAVAIDGESALSQAEYLLPDLVLMDVMMPGIDGFESCRQLLANPATKDIPVIFMTAVAEPSEKVRGFALGAVDYITKPFQKEEVIARVNLHLKLHALNKTIAEQNLQLEQQVVERTAELTQALAHLRSTQLQVIQSEKMSSIGQLVAGIAHEINNPLGFIGGNLSLAKQGITDLIDHLLLYREMFPAPHDRIDAHAEDIDLEFLMTDIPQLVASMQTGCNRIKDISNSLRTFSRSDTGRRVSFNIHDGLESTLMLLRHRLKSGNNRPEIQIVREYDELPPVDCYAGQLNQVFMNILANAVDAIEEMYEHPNKEREVKEPTILVKTQWMKGDNHTSDKAIVRIRDCGKGIPDEIRDNVFESLFTTKPVGQGTGLGLSISRQIVEEKHGGKLLLHSTSSEGTEFAIELPVNVSD